MILLARAIREEEGEGDLGSPGACPEAGCPFCLEEGWLTTCAQHWRVKPTVHPQTCERA